MSPEPSKLILACASKVPFFRGHGLGVQHRKILPKLISESFRVEVLVNLQDMYIYFHRVRIWSQWLSWTVSRLTCNSSQFRQVKSEIDAFDPIFGVLTSPHASGMGLSPWGTCTNHVDRILGNFDPPLPYVDTFTK